MISRTKAWAMWFIASIFYAYQYILRVLPSITIDEITSKFDMDAARFGQFSGLYYFGYTLMHLPIGIMLDRLGPKKVMPILILIAALGNLPLINSDFYIYPIIGRFLVGVGSSAAILSVFMVIRLGFPEKEFTKMLSFAVTIGLIGAIYGGEPVNYLKALFGYDKIVLMLIISGIILSLISFVIMPGIVTKKEKFSIIRSLKTVCTNWKILLICLLSGLMVGPLEGFADVWGKEFFKVVYSYKDDVAASLPSIIFLGMCFGSPILSIIASRTGSYLGAILISAIVMGISFIGIIIGIPNMTLLSLVLCIVGILCSYQIIAIYKASTYSKEETVGLTTAVANMIIMAFGYLFHTIIGKVISIYTDHSISNWSKEALTYGIAVIPIALFIATIGFAIFILVENKHKTIRAKR